MLNTKYNSFNGLRDTYASFLFAQDIDIAYVSKQLDHITTQKLLSGINTRKRAPARCRCFKSVFAILIIDLNQHEPKTL
ncbi:hypothetical protein P9D47_05080 [Bacillus haynesii]|uniref:hypothetical protein n=1 Tax=Bacillus haynesii TaxID=1925021 RepID=UPI0020CCC938|nr:hypothetical protein [Bacillus haynesii]MCY7781067.1 hypothetical protein [Bacillus haynesii]MEC0668895.1 hypothetical protein [Bacillus haynesii]MEC1417360.1 hypothetical protein [Bacillus haynesii]MEC1467431.1 hypothetical protein [Bacillus haynesii]